MVLIFTEEVQVVVLGTLVVGDTTIGALMVETVVTVVTCDEGAAIISLGNLIGLRQTPFETSVASSSDRTVNSFTTCDEAKLARLLGDVTESDSPTTEADDNFGPVSSLTIRTDIGLETGV